MAEAAVTVVAAVAAVAAAMPAAVKTTAPSRSRSRCERGGAKSGGRDESDTDLAKHDNLLWFRDARSAASCPIGGDARCNGSPEAAGTNHTEGRLFASAS